METKIVPTAEEFIRNEYEYFSGELPSLNCEGHHVKFMMQEFAKLHVQAALKTASKKIVGDALETYGTTVADCWSTDSILNAYPETNIK